MNNSAKFWDRIATKYSKQPVANEQAYQTKLKHTQTYLHPDMKMLEFGCGTGSTAIAHSSFVHSIKAVDISSKMIEIAKNKVQQQAISNIEFEVNTLEGITCEHQSMDVVLGLSILHLLEDWQGAIKTVHHLLKPEGLFVSSTACVKHLWPLRLLAPIGQFAGLIPTLSFFSGEELKQCLIEQGFEIEHFWQPQKNAGIFIIARKK